MPSAPSRNQLVDGGYPDRMESSQARNERHSGNMSFQTGEKAEVASPVKTTSSVHDIGAEKPPFGSRFLTNEADVWSQNAWDHVPPPDDQDATIAASLLKQRSAPVPSDEKPRYNTNPSRHWDNFYKNNASNFFRDRKWLHNEFPELVQATQPESGPQVIAEIGCGAGNSVFPVLSNNKNPDLELHAYDYSSHAVKLVQNNPLYASPPLGSISAAVWDLTSPEGLPPDLRSESVDIIILVFVLSALHPDEWSRALLNIHKALKPGGLVVLRDYGRYDLTQIRFKTGRLLDENLYIRGDKTRVYFFELEELALLFTGTLPNADQVTDKTTTEVEEERSDTPTPLSTPAGVHTPTQEPTEPPSDAGQPIADIADSGQPSTGEQAPNRKQSTAQIHPILLTPLPNLPPHPLFKIEQLGVDRRLLINRKRQLKMYRVWMQGKFRKL